MARSPLDDPGPLRVLVVDDDPGTLDCLREEGALIVQRREAPGRRGPSPSRHGR